MNDTTTATLSKEQLDKTLQDWQEAKHALDRWKEHEAQLRRYIIEHGGLFDPSKEEGTETVNLGNGYKLKAKKVTNYTVANKEGEAFAVLQKLTELGEVSANKAKDLFRFDANIRVSNYKKLDDAEKALVDNIVTTKPGMPSLELVEPKGQTNWIF